MLYGVSQAYQQACIAVLSPTKAIFGSGVAIGGDRFATCAHVVARALGCRYDARQEDLPRDKRPYIRQPYLSGAESEPLEVEIESFRSRADHGGFADIAILALTSDAAESMRRRAAEMPRFSRQVPDMHESLFVTGFPEKRDLLKSLSDHASYRAVAPHDNEWIGIEDERGFGSEIRPGFSGAPVWSRTQRAIVGLVSEADWARRTAAIIPNVFLRRLVELPEAGGTAAAGAPSAPEITRVIISAPNPLRRALDRTVPWLHRWLTLDAQLLAPPASREPIADVLREMAVEFEQEIAERTYLPPPTRQLPRVPEQSGFRPIRQLIREVSGGFSGGDGADAYISALSRRSRRIANLLGTLRRSRQPIILLGDPGAGKSLTLQQVAIAFARQQERRIYPSLCIFIRLGRWEPVQPPAEPDTEAVRTLVRFACPPSLVSGLDALDRQGRLLVIFDGMDEMSRYRYVEHTTALHKYAGFVEGRVRTLFSCRIADFAPTFRHRRLVLLPFDRRHVEAYLHRQFVGEPIELDGQFLTAHQLSERLVSDELPVRATNPYVLYLLSLYIQNNKTIPTRRTQLLSYYFSLAIERKAAELEAQNLPTAPDKLFGLWARVALAITSVNAGSEVRRTELDLLLGPDAEAAVRSGRTTGVIVESLDQDPEAPALVRFESHRAQEYFTAHAIATSTDAFDWSARLDVPRWQETLVNVAQMGAAGAAIAELARTLEAVPELWQGSDEPARRIWMEIEAAERVDLAARVLRDLPLSPEREGLRELVTEAARQLIMHGTGVSKTAALRTIQQAPEIGRPDVIAPALQDKSGWVRDQAYVVQSQLAGEKGTASVLEEVGLAYAHGESTRRLPRYLLLARKLKRLDLTLMATVGAVLEVMRIALAAAVGPVLVFVALHLLHSARVGSGQFPPFVILHDHGAWILEHGDGIRLGAVMLAVALATFVARLDMQHATLWLSAAGIAFVCAPALLVFLWAWAPMVKLSSLVFGVFGLVGFGYAMRYVIPLLSLAIWGVCALAFAAIIRLSAGSSDMAGRMLAAAWRESEQEELVGEAVALAGCAVVLAVLWIPLSAALRVLTLWFTYFSNLIGMEAGILAGFILITPVWLICVFVLPFFLPLLRGQGFNFDREFRSSVQLWPLAAIPAVLFVWVLIFAKLPEYLIPLLTSLDRFSSLLIYPVYALVLTLLLIVVGSLAYVTYSVLSPILRRLTRLVVQPQRTTISEWLAEVAASAPAEQARLLRDANPARFNIGLEQTIEAVASLQPVIHEEPARSVYDAKMSELVAIRRQRRAG